MKILVVLLASILFFTGCEFQQNPIQGASDAVQNGKEPGQKVDAAKAVPKGVMTIDGPLLVNGRIGSELEMKLTGRVATLDKPLEAEIFIENLADFPGATFDSATGVFKWTPTKEKVYGQPSAAFVVNAVISSIKSDFYPVSMSERQSFPIVVTNDPTKPIVKSATVSASYGTSRRVEVPVLIEDLDATSSSEVNLSFHECYSPSDYSQERSFVALTRLKGMTVDEAPGAFTANVSLELDLATKYPQGKYCFAVVATSKFGIASDPYRISFGITPGPQTTYSTWNDTRAIKQGQVQEYNFSIFDITGNGVLSLEAPSNIAGDLPGSSITCVSSTRRSQLDCTALIVTTTSTTPMPYRPTLKVLNTITATNEKLTTTHNLPIKVEAAP